MTIGVTDTMGNRVKFERYLAWLRSGSIPIDVRVLSYLGDDARAVSDCDGIVLTGGGDVDPSLYGGNPGHPGLIGVDPKRDAFESALLGKALGAGIPLLGICRGLQLANVHFGGTLVPDLEEAGRPGHRGGPGADPSHPLDIEAGTLLRGIARSPRVTVGSSHHQAVEKPGRGLRIAARAADGVVEALEYADPGAKPFFLLVQWHPEKAHEAGDPLSAGILENLLQAVQTTPKHIAEYKERTA